MGQAQQGEGHWTHLIFIGEHGFKRPAMQIELQHR